MSYVEGQVMDRNAFTYGPNANLMSIRHNFIKGNTHYDREDIVKLMNNAARLETERIDFIKSNNLSTYKEANKTYRAKLNEADHTYTAYNGEGTEVPLEKEN